MSENTSIHVARAVAGDHDSVGWLVEHFQGLVRAQVRMRLRGHGTPQDVDDLAADVWVIVLQRLADLTPRDQRHAPVLVQFLGTTVLHVCNNFLRARLRQGARLAGSPTATASNAGDPLDRLPAATRAVLSRVLQKERVSAIDRCLRELPDDKRDVLVLRLMEHRSNQEIGELLGLPANTIAVRYRRALEALRERLPRADFRELCSPR